MSDQKNATGPQVDQNREDEDGRISLAQSDVQPKDTKSIPVVPAPVFKPSVTDKAFYCFPAGTSEADKQQDIERVNLWIEHIKAKRKAKK